MNISRGMAEEFKLIAQNDVVTLNHTVCRKVVWSEFFVNDPIGLDEAIEAAVNHECKGAVKKVEEPVVMCDCPDGAMHPCNGKGWCKR